jgi:hypothetical protein
MTIWAGQNASLCHSTDATEFVTQLIAEAESVIHALPPDVHGAHQVVGGCGGKALLRKKAYRLPKRFLLIELFSDGGPLCGPRRERFLGQRSFALAAWLAQILQTIRSSASFDPLALWCRLPL